MLALVLHRALAYARAGRSHVLIFGSTTTAVLVVQRRWMGFAATVMAPEPHARQSTALGEAGGKAIRCSVITVAPIVDYPLVSDWDRASVALRAETASAVLADATTSGPLSGNVYV
jgi:hypothetical protein